MSFLRKDESMEENACAPNDSGIVVAVDSDKSEGRSVAIVAAGNKACAKGGPRRAVWMPDESVPRLLGLIGVCIKLPHVTGAPGELKGPAGARSGSLSPAGGDCCPG